MKQERLFGPAKLPEQLRRVIVQADVLVLNLFSWLWGAKYEVEKRDRSWPLRIGVNKFVMGTLADQKDYRIKKVTV